MSGRTKGSREKLSRKILYLGPKSSGKWMQPSRSREPTSDGSGSKSLEPILGRKTL